MGALSRQLFRISIDETRFERRGFRGGGDASRRRLETIGATFVRGYHAALSESSPAPLARELNRVELELRGFAYEGAAMALALLDRLTPWRRDRWDAFLAGPGEPHAYMLHVGAGWAHARLGGDLDKRLAGHDPLLRWLVLDGWGFHEGYFHAARVITERRVPSRLDGYARRAFDQGLGRSLWFVNGAEVERVSASIGDFEPARRVDLWSGVGLAAAYAGDGSDSNAAACESLLDSAGDHRAAVSQGAAFGAEARRRAGNPAPHTERACRALCGVSAAAAAEATIECRRGLEREDPAIAYETWRQRVSDRLQQRAVAV